MTSGKPSHAELQRKLKEELLEDVRPSLQPTYSARWVWIYRILRLVGRGLTKGRHHVSEADHFHHREGNR